MDGGFSGISIISVKSIVDSAKKRFAEKIQEVYSNDHIDYINCWPDLPELRIFGIARGNDYYHFNGTIDGSGEVKRINGIRYYLTRFFGSV